MATKHLIEQSAVVAVLKEHFDTYSDEFDAPGTTAQRKHEINGSLTAIKSIQRDVKKLQVFEHVEKVGDTE